MTHIIWRYSFLIARKQLVSVPINSVVLSVDGTGEMIDVWMIVPSDALTFINKEFHMIEDAEIVTDLMSLRFWKTVRTTLGIRHVFERVVPR